MRSHTQLLVAITMALVAVSAAAGPKSADLRVVSFNVLAPLWASPVWYPADLDPALLDRAFRRARIQAFLASVRRDVDIVCLQEVEQAELPFLLSALGNDFEGGMAVNDEGFWSAWLAGNPWAPNGTAVAVRKTTVANRLFADLGVSDDGNHVAAVTGVLAAGGRPVRVFSVHLDSDSTANRGAELDSLMAQAPPYAGYVDVVCGDINEDTITGTAAGIFKRNGYVDVLASVGNREPTHPFSSTYYASHRWAIIDHVMVRGAAPVGGDVFDSGLWSISDELERIEENFRRVGSDHFPIAGQVRP